MRQEKRSHIHRNKHGSGPLRETHWATEELAPEPTAAGTVRPHSLCRTALGRARRVFGVPRGDRGIVDHSEPILLDGVVVMSLAGPVQITSVYLVGGLQCILDAHGTEESMVGPFPYFLGDWLWGCSICAA
jgi:hypothetical protein